MSNVNELLVFIASPGDLPEERAGLRDIERRINSIFGAAGLRVRVTGWEETPPGYGRPQSQLNQLVDDCDVFVGLLRRKWGSPTGLADSGFSEEFERAVTRRKESNETPQIAMFFASLSPGELEDAGPELQRVLDFKKRLETDHLVLYSMFNSPQDLVVQVTDLLSRLLLEIIANKRAPEQESGSVSEPPHNNSAVAADAVGALDGDEPAPDTAQQQILTTLDSLRAILVGDDSRSKLDLDRFQLVGTALGRDDTTLGGHLVNRLYARLDELHLIGAEYNTWLRTLLSDVGQHDAMSERVMPGWALVSQDPQERASELVELAKTDDVVGRGAIKSLRRLRARPSVLWPDAQNPGVELDADAEPRDPTVDEWVSLLNAHPGHSDVTDYLLDDTTVADADAVASALLLIERVLGSSEVNEDSRAFLESAQAALNGDPNALADKLGYSSNSSQSWDLALDQVEKLDVKMLNRLASQSYNRRVKLASTKHGLCANKLSDSTLSTLLFEDQEESRDMLLCAATESADQAQLLLALLNNKSSGKTKPTGLEARLLAEAASLDAVRELDEHNIIGSTAWEALTHLIPEEIAPAAREVLSTDASDLRALLNLQLDNNHQLVDYLADDRKRVAAALLARLPESSAADQDLVLAWFAGVAQRKYIPLEAWKILETLAARPSFVLPEHYLDEYQDSLQLSNATDLLTGPLAAPVAAVLRNSDNAWIREPAQKWFITQMDRTDEELEDALYDDSAEIRTAAAASLAARLDREQTRAVLTRYPTRGGSYWYNVIAYIDQHLHAPDGSLKFPAASDGEVETPPA